MLKVYAVPVSLYCAKLRILLRHKSLNWDELLPPGGYGSAEYKMLVPSGNLPALVDGDVQLADSEAIAEYLNEKFPDPKMLPSDLVQRAKVRELSRFHDTRLEPAVRALFAHIPLASRDNARAGELLAVVFERLDQLSGLVEGRGDEVMLCDCGLPVTFVWIDELAGVFGHHAKWPAAVAAYRNRVEGHRAVSAELAAYRPRLTAWLAGRVDD
jgi:glutathione S-transferase